MAHDAMETRSRLLEAAGEIFAEKGYQAATVREICARADANLAAVNYHFGDKEKLYAAAVRHAHQSGTPERFSERMPGMAPETRLRHIVRMMLERIIDAQRPAWHSRLMARELGEPTQAGSALVESYIRARFQVLDRTLAELMPPGTAEEERHLMVFSIVGQCIHFKIHRHIAKMLVGQAEVEQLSAERLAEHIARLTLAAIGREEPLAGRAPVGEASP